MYCIWFKGFLFDLCAFVTILSLWNFNWGKDLILCRCFIYRGVYYECCCSCSGVVLQKGIRCFKNGMLEYHVKLLLCQLWNSKQKDELVVWASILEISYYFFWAVCQTWLILKLLYVEVRVLKVNLDQIRLLVASFKHIRRLALASYFQCSVYWVMHIGWASYWNTIIHNDNDEYDDNDGDSICFLGLNCSMSFQ